MSISAEAARLDWRLAGHDVLVLPGWNNSGPGHWQTRWQAHFPDWRRVGQANWTTPRRGDWIAGLDAAVARCHRPVVLVAHSLGCITVAHWARHRAGSPVVAALLVAPADVERSDVATPLRDFAPLPRAPLPFPALVIASDNDPACCASRAGALARDWNADLNVLAGVGHINADSGLGDWETGMTMAADWLATLRDLAPSARRSAIRV